MSRILRRPMFRGGPVDSRGTGIASGLSYAKGGSVNTPKRGLVDGPGGYAGMGTGGYYDSLLGKGIRSVRDYVGKPFLNFINQDIANPILGLGGYGDFFERMETPWDDKYLLGLDENYDKIPSDEYVPYSARYSNKGKGPIKTDSGAIPKAIKEQDNAILLENLEAEKNKEKTLEEIMKEMMGPQQSKKEKIEEYKEIFKDAYGSGVADDASNMLLNFAGKALKPEATVKSAFGEFFEEEGKRPSERKKYKDAATTAAINAYLTGEKDYDSMMKQMKMIDYQIGAKSDAANAAKKNLSFIEIKSGLPNSISKDRARTKAAAELFIQYTDKGKSLTVIDADKETDEYLQDPANEGKYVMNNETKEVFQILNGIKQIIYGG